ncbi:MAG: hypothetical protein ACLP1Y_12595 [Candidatus Acidiferrales bacterium]
MKKHKKKGVPAPRQARVKPGRKLNPSQLLIESWTEVATRMREMIALAAENAIAGKPALLRLVSRFFKIPLKVSIEVPATQVVWDLPAPAREKTPTALRPPRPIGQSPPPDKAATVSFRQLEENAESIRDPQLRAKPERKQTPHAATPREQAIQDKRGLTFRSPGL